MAVEVTDTSPRMDYTFMSGDLQLSGHLAEPASTSRKVPGLVLCHGFPVRGREAPASGQSFPELADRIAGEMGWLVLCMNFRGCGRSEGDFSLGGWLDDIAAAVVHVRALGVHDVWLSGYGSGGSLCICEAARDPEIRGVAAMGAPADYNDWHRNPRRLLLHAREVGVVTTEKFPPSFDKWAAEFKDINPEKAAAALAPRPLLILHGEADDLVPSTDARALAEAHRSAELRIIGGGGHEMRHDPRAVAVLLGWLARQRHALSL